MTNFDVYVERVLRHEGGWVNHPSDPGGETNFGITWPTLRKAIADGLLPSNTTIRWLTVEQARICYHEYYYKPWLWIPSAALRFQVFDAYVNHSPRSVVLMLQRALGVRADGELGPVTMQAVKHEIEVEDERAQLIFKFLAQRQFHFIKQGTFDDFGEGWMKRMAENMQYAAEDL